MSGVVKFSITIFFYKFIAESASKKTFYIGEHLAKLQAKRLISVLLARLFCSLRGHGNFCYQIFSQGSMATYARCGGIFNNHFIANFVENLPMKEFLKSIKF